MTDTVNNGIPFVPENTTDPAAGLNLSLLTIDMLLNLSVESIGGTTPPATVLDGARYIVGVSATVAWSGHDNELAMWIDNPGYWQFRNANIAFNKDTASIWVLTTSWEEYATTPSASGEVNTASNLGSGSGLYKQKAGVDLQFKSLSAGTNCSLDTTTDPDIIIINATDTGEANTASNVGTGVGVFGQKSGVDLQFKTLKAGSNISLDTSVENEILINAASSATLGYASASLSANVSLTTTSTWYDGPSVSLPAGTWLVTGQITHNRSATTAETIFGRITNGTNHFSSSQMYHASVTNSGSVMTMTAIVTVAITTSVKIQATSSSGASTSVMLAATTANGSGNNATNITAIKIA